MRTVLLSSLELYSVLNALEDTYIQTVAAVRRDLEDKLRAAGLLSFSTADQPEPAESIVWEAWEDQEGLGVVWHTTLGEEEEPAHVVVHFDVISVYFREYVALHYQLLCASNGRFYLEERTRTTRLYSVSFRVLGDPPFVQATSPANGDCVWGTVRTVRTVSCVKWPAPLLSLLPEDSCGQIYCTAEEPRWWILSTPDSCLLSGDYLTPTVPLRSVYRRGRNLYGIDSSTGRWRFKLGQVSPFCDSTLLCDFAASLLSSQVRHGAPWSASFDESIWLDQLRYTACDVPDLFGLTLYRDGYLRFSFPSSLRESEVGIKTILLRLSAVRLEDRKRPSLFVRLASTREADDEIPIYVYPVGDVLCVFAGGAILATLCFDAQISSSILGILCLPHSASEVSNLPPDLRAFVSSHKEHLCKLVSASTPDDSVRGEG